MGCCGKNSARVAQGTQVLITWKDGSTELAATTSEARGKIMASEKAGTYKIVPKPAK